VCGGAVLCLEGEHTLDEVLEIVGVVAGDGVVLSGGDLEDVGAGVCMRLRLLLASKAWVRVIIL
jgi:hypothetical protein